MKKIQIFLSRLAVVCGLIVLSWGAAKSQVAAPYSYRVDWQFNAPFNDGFAERASGWGMNLEAAYQVTPNLSTGVFLGFHTNNRYIDRGVTQLSPSSFMNTDQVHQFYQLPFGMMANYRFIYDGVARPYLGVKTGAVYTQCESYFNIYNVERNLWGFYLSPEVGVDLFPWTGMAGVHVALYYAWNTVRTTQMPGYDVKGVGNIGFRLGLSF